MTETDFWRNKRVLVTGGTGFIGSHLTDHSSRSGALVTVVSCSGVARLGLRESPAATGDLRDPEPASDLGTSKSGKSGKSGRELAWSGGRAP